MRHPAVGLSVVGLLRVLLVGSTATGQGFPFPKTPTRTPTRTMTPTATPRAVTTPVATPTPRPTVPQATPTRTPPVASGDCVVPWPTRTPGKEIHLSYRWSGRGACFDNVSDDELGPAADVFLSVNGGQSRQLRWQMTGCWVYADDGTIPYALPEAGAPSVRFMFTLRKGAAIHSAGIDFFPPSYVPPTP